MTTVRSMGVASATVLQNGQVLVAGGSSQASAELCNPGTGKWTATGAMSTSREGQKAVLLQSGQVLVAGGAKIGGTSSSMALTSAELYQP
jgi:hypothetical protein